MAFTILPAKNSSYRLPDGKTGAELEATYNIAKYDISGAKAEISPVTYAGAGVPVLPSKSDIKNLKTGSILLTEDDYNIESASNNTKVGKAYVTLRGRKLRGKKPEGKPAGAQITPEAALKPMREYALLDPGFNEAAFREHMSNLYVQMQQEKY